MAGTEGTCRAAADGDMGFSPGHLAGVGNCAQVKNDMPAKSEQWASPGVLWWFALLKSILAGQDANSRVGTRRGALESFLFHVLEYVCVLGLCVSYYYLIHMLTGEKKTKNIQKI